MNLKVKLNELETEGTIKNIRASMILKRITSLEII
jgi:hypothetical protein